jgi:hypothetical protein
MRLLWALIVAATLSLGVGAAWKSSAQSAAVEPVSWLDHDAERKLLDELENEDDLSGFVLHFDVCGSARDGDDGHSK